MDLNDKKKEDLVLLINKNFSQCFFCGSFSLNLLELIDRPIHDIDICVPIQYKNNAIRYFYDLKYGFLYNKWFRFIHPYKILKLFDSMSSNYIKMNIHGVSCCIFFENESRCILFPYKSTKIRISFPERTIEAKKTYIVDESSNNTYGEIKLETKIKHQKDIESYNKNKSKYEKLLKLKEILGEIEIIYF